MEEQSQTKAGTRIGRVMATSSKAARLLLAAIALLACSKSQSTPKPSAGEPPSRSEPPPATTTVAAAPSSEASGRALVALPTLAPLIESVKAAVINVEVRSRAPARRRVRGAQDPWGDFFDRFFGGPPTGRGGQPRERLREGLGSGFIIDKSGIALTNNHVIEGAVAITVRLNDGRSFDAQVLGRDPLTDIGLIKFKGTPQDLPMVPLGDSDAMRVGDWVVAIGNPYGLASSVSAGIISAKDRVIGAGPYDDFLQTDAAVNPGNSGGPLFNLRGEVIGINTAIVGGGTSIGFAVPSKVAKSLVPALAKEGHVTRGWIGITAQPLTPELGKALGVPAGEGAVVTYVTSGSPAQKGGLRPDDVIVAMDGQPVPSHNALTRMVALTRPGTVVGLAVLRGEKKEEVKITLEPRPDFEGLGTGNEEGGGSDENRSSSLGLQYDDVERLMARAHGLPDQGALITDVAPGSPAASAGLAPGGLVIEAGGKPIKRAQDLRNVLRQAKPGDVVLMRVASQGGTRLHALKIPK